MMSSDEDEITLLIRAVVQDYIERNSDIIGTNTINLESIQCNKSNNKYELTDEVKVVEARTLRRIRALIDTPTADVKAGDLGWYIQYTDNLSQSGDSWIHKDACVFEKAKIVDNAIVMGSAVVYGEAYICGNSYVMDNARIFGDVTVGDNVVIGENAIISGINARILGDVNIYGNARVSLNRQSLQGNAYINGNAHIQKDTDVLFVDSIPTSGSPSNITFYRTYDGKIGVNNPSFLGTLEEYKKLRDNNRIHGLLIELAESSINPTETKVKDF